MKENNYLPYERFDEIITQLTGEPMPSKRGRKPSKVLIPSKEELVELCKFGGGFSINGYYIIATHTWWRGFRKFKNKTK
jgi:hypothetical protein